MPGWLRTKLEWDALRRVGLVVAFRVASVAAGLVYIKVYTHWLTPVEIGVFFYLTTLSYGLNALIFVPVDFYMQVRLSRLVALPIPGLALLFKHVVAAGLMACVCLAAPFVLLGSLAPIDVPGLFLLAILLYLCASARGILNNREHPIFVSSMLLCEALLRLAAFVIGAVVIGASARVLLYSSVAALGIEFAVIAVFARRHLAFTASTAITLDPPRTVFRSAAPVSCSAVANVLQLQAYRVLYPLEGLSAISGTYAVVSNLGAAAMAAAGSIFSQIHLPKVYNSNGDYIGTYMKLAALLTVVTLSLGLAFKGMLVPLLTSAEYLPYAWALGFGIVTEGVNLMIGAATVFLMIQGRPGKLLIANLVAAIASASGFGLVLIARPADPLAIGFPIVVSQLVMMWVIYHVAFRSSEKRAEVDL